MLVTVCAESAAHSTSPSPLTCSLALPWQAVLCMDMMAALGGFPDATGLLEANIRGLLVDITKDTASWTKNSFNRCTFDVLMRVAGPVLPTAPLSAPRSPFTHSHAVPMVALPHRRLPRVSTRHWQCSKSRCNPPRSQSCD